MYYNLLADTVTKLVVVANKHNLNHLKVLILDFPLEKKKLIVRSSKCIIMIINYGCILDKLDIFNY